MQFEYRGWEELYHTTVQETLTQIHHDHKRNSNLEMFNKYWAQDNTDQAA